MWGSVGHPSHFLVSRNAQLNQLTAFHPWPAFRFSRFPMNRYVKKSGLVRVLDGDSLINELAPSSPD